MAVLNDEKKVLLEGQVKSVWDLGWGTLDKFLSSITGQAVSVGSYTE